MRYPTRKQIANALAQLPRLALQCTGSLSLRRNRSGWKGTACNWRNTSDPGWIAVTQTYHITVIGPLCEVVVSDDFTPAFVATCRIKRQRIRWTVQEDGQAPRRHRALTHEERRIAEFFRTL